MTEFLAWQSIFIYTSPLENWVISTFFSSDTFTMKFCIVQSNFCKCVWIIGSFLDLQVGVVCLFLLLFLIVIQNHIHITRPSTNPCIAVSPLSCKLQRVLCLCASVMLISFNKKDTFCNCFNQLGLTQLHFDFHVPNKILYWIGSYDVIHFTPFLIGFWEHSMGFSLIAFHYR